MQPYSYLYKMTCLFLVTGWISYSSGNTKIPYEKCNWINKGYTERVLKDSKKQYGPTEDTEACTDCLNKERLDRLVSSLLTVTKKKANSIPTHCFLASALRSTEKEGSESRNNYYYCKSPLSKKPSRVMIILNPKEKKLEERYARRTCLSQDYINTTAETFHYMSDCFGYSSLKEKQELFSLFNHESSFILNNKSDSFARCYGQLTEETVDQMDKFLHLDTPDHKQYKDVYKEALARCPDLKEKLILPKFIYNKGKKSLNKLLNTQRKLDPTCRVTQHPQTCFFYSIYNVATNKVRFDRNMNYVVKGKKLPKNASNKEALRRDFKLPIKLPEILHVKGTVKRNGKDMQVDWIFQDDYELHKVIKNLKYDPKNLQVKKINLYKDVEKMELFTVHTSHNGGAATITEYFEGFLRSQKDEIARKCRVGSKSKFCKYRKKIKQGRSLDYDSYTKDFSRYLRKKYKGSWTRKMEVSNFFNKILEDKKYLANDENFLSDHLNKMHKNNPEISKKDLDDFIKISKEQCTGF